MRSTSSRWWAGTRARRHDCSRWIGRRSPSWSRPRSAAWSRIRRARRWRAPRRAPRAPEQRAPRPGRLGLVRYFVPDIRVGSELRKQTALEDKFGGLPWGLRAARWPRCAECRKSMSFLAQLLHHPVRLDLGREGRVLFAFQCDGVTCATYEGSSGANACFVSEPEWLTDGPSARPMDRRSLEHEVRVARWDDRDDGVPDALMPRFFDYDDHLALDDGIVEQLYFATRLGSAPAWIQAAQEPP